MSASTEQGERALPQGRPVQFWRPAGAVFLALSVGALAVGVFPELVLQPDYAGRFPHPPALQVLLAAQAGLLILFWPLVAARRRTLGGGARRMLPGLATFAVEYLVVLAVSVPLYAIAAWFSDATAVDVLRGGLYLTAVAAGAWGLSLWILKGHPTTATAVTLASALAAVGLPMIYYLLAEVTELSAPPQWMVLTAPATCAYSVAASRAASWQPMPLWSWAFWPGVAAALAFARLLVRDRPAGNS